MEHANPRETPEVAGKARRPGIGAELLPLLLILASLGTTWALVISVYRQREATRKPPAPAASPPVATPAPVVQNRPSMVVAPSPEPPEDPTPKELARLAALETEQKAAAEQARTRAASLRRARRAAEAEADRLRRRESSIRSRAEALDSLAQQMEQQTDELSVQLDALEHERDAAKAEMTQLQKTARSGYAILPYKGTNGTWRRPIAIECRGDSIRLQPDGPSFNLLEISPLAGLRSNPLLITVARAIIQARRAGTPDGTESEPYIVFVVRPDGIEAYFLSLAIIKAAGIPFGYELVDQNVDVAFPNLDDLKEWPDPRADAGGSLAETPPTSPADRLADRVGGWGTGPASAGDGPGGWPDLQGRGRPTGWGSDPGRLLGSVSDPRRSGSGPGWGGGGGGGFSSSSSGRTESEGDSATGSYWRQGPSGGSSPLSGGIASAGDGRVAITPAQPGGLPHSANLADALPDFDLPPSTNSGPMALGDETSGGTSGGGTRAGAASGSGLPPGGMADWAGGNGSAPGGGAPPFGTPGTGPQGGPAQPSLTGRGAPSSRSGQPGSSTAVGGGSSGTGTPGSRPSGLTGLSGSGGEGRPAHGVRMPNLAGALPRAEKTLEMLVECGPEQLVIHPGGLRLKLSDVKTNENLLISQLEQAVFSARVDDPTTDWKPTVRFLIKPEGQQTFWIARRQMLVGGLNWPVTLQVADAEVRRLLDTETPR